MNARIEPHVVLQYQLRDGYLERRAALREAHLALVGELRAEGLLTLAGAFEDPVDEALLVFATADVEVARNFAKRDPYVQSGLVERYSVRRWSVVKSD